MEARPIRACRCRSSHQPKFFVVAPILIGRLHPPNALSTVSHLKFRCSLGLRPNDLFLHIRSAFRSAEQKYAADRVATT